MEEADAEAADAEVEEAADLAAGAGGSRKEPEAGNRREAEVVTANQILRQLPGTGGRGPHPRHRSRIGTPTMFRSTSPTLTPHTSRALVPVRIAEGVADVGAPATAADQMVGEVAALGV